MDRTLGWKQQWLTAIAVFVLCGLSGCGKDSEDVPGPGDADTASDSTAGGDADADGDADTDADVDADTEICDAQDFAVVPKPVALMILLDRSSSMVINPNAPPTRWSEAVNAIGTVLNNWKNPYLEVGIDFFPDGSQWRGRQTLGDCGVSNPVQKDAAANNNENVLSFVKSVDPPPVAGSMTPLWCAMNNFLNPSYAARFTSLEVQPYLLLLSDGSDSCGLDCSCLDAPETCGKTEFGATAQQLGDLSAALLAKRIKTLVIGFGGGVEAIKFDAIVQNGGTSFTSYLFADNEQQLIAAFDEIAAEIVPCEYELDISWEEVDRKKVNFYFDDTVVKYVGDGKTCESSEGWAWANAEQTAIAFCQQSCASLKTGKIKKVSAKFGCPTVVVL